MSRFAGVLVGALMLAGCTATVTVPPDTGRPSDGSPSIAASASVGPFGGGRVYWSRTDGIQTGVYSAKPDGSDRTKLPFAFTDTEVAWSRDATRVVVVRPGQNDAAWTVLVGGPEGQNLQKVASFARSFVYGPDWAPDGRRLAVTLVAQGGDVGRGSIAILDLVGKDPPIRISQEASADRTAWSPDGSRIAYTSSTGGAIWTVHPDGNDIAQLTHGRDSFPAWSPDGSRIAFERDVSDGASASVDHDLWVANADGSDPHAVTSGPADDEFPAWSPDGTALAFARFPPGGGKPDICLLAPDGTIINLTNTPDAAETVPSWH